ncbi:hypothetical protein [Arthrobacter sp. MMS24-S77]
MFINFFKGADGHPPFLFMFVEGVNGDLPVMAAHYFGDLYYGRQPELRQPA